MTKKTFDVLAKNVGYATIATGALLLVKNAVKAVKKAVSTSSTNEIYEDFEDEDDECSPAEDTAEEEITAE